MKNIFLDRFGDLRIGWMIALVFGFVFGPILLAMWHGAGERAKFFTQVTGKPMTQEQALWVEPEFTVGAGGEITVKVEQK